MLSFTKFFLISATVLSALTAVSAEAHAVTRSGEEVLAAHRQVAEPTPVVYHRHRHRHHVRRPVHR